MSDDFVAFEAQQNGQALADSERIQNYTKSVEAEEAPKEPPEAEEAPVEAEPAEEGADEAPEAPEQPNEAPKPKKTAQDRFDELTAKRREAEREANYWRNVAEGKTPHPQRQPEKQEAQAPVAPRADDYDLGDLDPRYRADHDKYVDALVDYRVERGLDKVRSGVAQDLHIQAGERVWEARQDAARSKFADYDDKVISGAHNWPCSPEMAEAIKTSDAGGELAYHLASNPEEARRIASLSPIAQVRELGRIEARLETGSLAPVKTTNAPKPATVQARGAGGHFASNGATQNFAEFEAMANRK